MKDEKGSSAAKDMNTSLPEGKRARTGQVDRESKLALKDCLKGIKLTREWFSLSSLHCGFSGSSESDLFES